MGDLNGLTVDVYIYFLGYLPSGEKGIMGFTDDCALDAVVVSLS